MVGWGQFHQPSGAKHKCASSSSLAPVCAVQFHQQKYAQLYMSARLENTFNSYALCSAQYASKFSISGAKAAKAQKLPVES